MLLSIKLLTELKIRYYDLVSAEKYPTENVNNTQLGGGNKRHSNLNSGGASQKHKSKNNKTKQKNTYNHRRKYKTVKRPNRYH